MKTRFRMTPVNLIAAFVFLLFLLPAVTVTGQTKYGDKTAAFFKILTSGTYHIKIRLEIMPGKTMDMETFCKDGKSSGPLIGTYNRKITRDNKIFYIDDPGKRMIISSSEGESGGGGFAPAPGVKFTGSGTAVFAGKNLPYDEYTAPDGTKVWYFVDGSKLAGIRGFNEDGKTNDIVVLVLDQNIPANVFDIPTGYKVES